VLLAYKANRHDTVVGVDDGRPEQRFEHENAFSMVPKGPVSRISKDRLRLVKPLVERQVIFHHPSPFPD
tara:strand:- start:1528 stop:1734 length:207 start_codon:yes stop_codon:yes gene_type:complete